MLRCEVNRFQSRQALGFPWDQKLVPVSGMVISPQVLKISPQK